MDFFGGGRKKGSPAEEQLNALLLDDYTQLINTFELNKIASLTYGDLVCDEIFEVLEKIISKPLDKTPVTLLKTLAVMKHIMIYGAEKCVNSAYGLGGFVEPLEKYNTILIAAQQKGAAGVWQRIQGGGVDKGGPVREKAQEISQLLKNINELQRIRHSSADPNSLVPIGSQNKVGFVTDEVRHHILKKRIEEQQRVMIKSNLVKSEGGFGGGYNATDGKSVVGAAHGIEEMLKMAQREQKKYTDDQRAQGYQSPAELKILEELQKELEAQKKAAAAEQSAANERILSSAYPYPPQQDSAVGDLLDFGAPQQTTSTSTSAGDLLSNFGGSSAPPSTTTSTAYNEADPFGFASSSTPASMVNGLGGPSILTHDPFSGIESSSAQTQSTNNNFSGMPQSQQPITANNMPTQQSHDPFAFASNPSSAPLSVSSGPPTDLLGADEQASAAKSLSGAMSSALGGMTSTMAKLGLSSPRSEDTSTPSISVSADTYGVAPSSQPGIATTSSADDRFAALDALSAAPSTSAAPAPTGFEGMSSPTTDTVSLSAASIYGSSSVVSDNTPASNTSYGNGTTTSNLPTNSYNSAPSQQVTTPGIGQVSQIVGTTIVGDQDDDDNNNPWVMGGKAGTGLGDPVAPAPAAPPPPPMW
jgi:hypothetical protein